MEQFVLLCVSKKQNSDETNYIDMVTSGSANTMGT